jgi:hypothetical protein
MPLEASANHSSPELLFFLRQEFLSRSSQQVAPSQAPVGPPPKLATLSSANAMVRSRLTPATVSFQFSREPAPTKPQRGDMLGLKWHR